MIWVVSLLSLGILSLLAVRVFILRSEVKDLRARNELLWKVVMEDYTQLLGRVKIGIENLQTGRNTEDVEFLVSLLMRASNNGAPDEKVARLVRELEPYIERKNYETFRVLKERVSCPQCPVEPHSHSSRLGG